MERFESFSSEKLSTRNNMALSEQSQNIPRKRKRVESDIDDNTTIYNVTDVSTPTQQTQQPQRKKIKHQQKPTLNLPPACTRNDHFNSYGTVQNAFDFCGINA